MQNNKIYFMRKKILLFILLHISVASFSQSVKVDSPFAGKGIKNITPAVRKYLQYTETAKGLIMFQSILTREIKKERYEGQEQFLIIQTYQSGNSIDKDSSYCDATTLMPLAYYSDIQSEGHKEKVIFTNDGIESSITFKDSIKKFQRENRQLYNGVMADEIISAMPLKMDARFVFKAVNPGLRHFEYSETVIVVGKEEIVVPGIGTVLCWKLRTASNAGMSAFEWYSVKEQVQIKKRFEFKNGDVFYRVLLAGV
jgi:hypothetical protein